MSNRGPEVDWARTAEFSTPLRWGEVESEILSRPPPQFEKGEYTGPMTATKVVGAGGAGAIALGALALTAPLVGLLLVVLAVTGVSDGVGAARWTLYVFLAAAVSVMLVILAWAEESRKGSFPRLAMAIVNAVAATVSFILLQTGSGEFAGGALSWLILGVAVGGLIAALLVGLASQSWSRPTAARDRPDQTEEGARYMAARVEVLEILIRRGLVERGDVDITEMMEMPLGTGTSLTRRSPDSGRVGRRLHRAMRSPVLECRRTWPDSMTRSIPPVAGGGPQPKDGARTRPSLRSGP